MQILFKKYPDLSRDENEQLRQYFIANTLIKSGSVEKRVTQTFVRMANQVYDLDDLSIDLITLLTLSSTHMKLCRKILHQDY